MMPEQADLLVQAQSSLEAAKLLRAGGYVGFAAARAYYTMFYVAEAFLLGKDLAFSKHSAVHSAFGLHFCKPLTYLIGYAGIEPMTALYTQTVVSDNKADNLLIIVLVSTVL